MKERGFTLIELLVVIAIVGLLASMVLASVSQVRVKARDTRKIQDFRSIATAMALYYNTFNRYPRNYNCNGSFSPSGTCVGGSMFGACEAPVPGTPGAEGFPNIVPAAYEASMQELVDAGLLKYIPRSPGGAGYCYYDFGSGTQAGALLLTALEAAPDSVNGIPPSCRPWTSVGGTWCEQRSSKEFCLCNAY